MAKRKAKQKNWGLVQAIVEKGLNQRDFAKAMGVHESVVSCVVNMRMNLSDEDKEAWSSALRKPVSVLWPHEKPLTEEEEALQRAQAKAIKFA